MDKLQEFLTQSQIKELESIYWTRHPTEACGLITPTPYNGKTVHELPNRSLEPQTSYVMKSSDIRLELSGWFDEHPDELGGVVFWHTHPSGNPKASKADRENRVQGAMNLIIASPDTRSIELYWF